MNPLFIMFKSITEEQEQFLIGNCSCLESEDCWVIPLNQYTDKMKEDFEPYEYKRV